MLVCLIIAAVAYLLGSIPTGYLVGMAKGIDVRKVGSGNIGATNAFRILGKGPGIFVLLVDALKGWVAAAWVPVLAHKIVHPVPDWSVESFDWLKILASICVFLGHNYTCWLKFKGGKGIATSAGILFALVPWAFVISLSTWIICCLVTRYVSVASIAAALVLPFAVWLTGYDRNFVLLTAVMSALAIYKHKGNIGRLLNGTESRLGKKKVPPAAPANL